MSRHEVITLQFGSFANFAGAHFWNIQVLILVVDKRCCDASVDEVDRLRLNPLLISPG